MSKVRVYELARELGVDTAVVESRCRDLGILADGHLTQLSSEEVDRLKRAIREQPAGGVTQTALDGPAPRRREEP